MLSPATQKIVTDLLIISSILLIAGITYIYTNRNKRETIVFTLFACFCMGIIKLTSVVHLQLNQHFLGAYDIENLPYMAAEPGWSLLLHAWHIWALPVVFVTIICIVNIIFLWRRKKPGNSALINAEAPVLTQTQRLNTFMAVDATKKAEKETRQKLAEALRLNAAYEVKLTDSALNIKTLQDKLQETQKALHEEIETLTLELSVKNKENEYLTNQLSERNRELKRAQEMFEKLAELHRRTQA